MRNKVVFVILSVLLLCIIIYVAASLLSIQTVDAAAMQVISYQKHDEQIKMAVGIGVSSRVLVSYDYQVDHDHIYVKVKQAPISVMFLTENRRAVCTRKAFCLPGTAFLGGLLYGGHHIF